VVTGVVGTVVVGTVVVGIVVGAPSPDSALAL
jgi:hypothetical protein